MGKQKTAAIVAIAITNLLLMIALGPVSAILPTIAMHFNADVAAASWVVTSFLLVLTSGLLISGRLGDLYGHRRVFLVGAILYTIVGTACGFAQDFVLLIVLRGMQGLGMAMMAGNSLAIVAHVFTARERGRAIGIAGMASSFGVVIGVTASSVMAQYLNWQWLFFLTLPLGMIGIKSALDMGFDFRPKERPKVDVVGAVLLAVAVVTLSLALTHVEGGESGFREEWYHHAALLAVSAVALVLFVLAERRAVQPIVDLNYLRNAPFSFSIVANEILHMTMMSSLFLMPFLLERGLGFAPVYTAGTLVSAQLGNIVMAPISGTIHDRTRWRFLCPVGMVSISAGMAVLGLFGPSMSYPGLLVVSFVLGMGLGFFMTPNNTIIVGSVPEHLRGFAAGMLETSRQFGHTLGVGASSAVMGAAVVGIAQGGPAATGYIVGYQQAMLVASGIAFLGIFAALVHSLSPQARPERQVPALQAR